jgi:translation elongation factor EF-G
MLNFNTEQGTPVHVDNSKEPTFYIDCTSVDFVEKARELHKNVQQYAEKTDKTEINDLEDDEQLTVFLGEFKKEYDYILEQIDNLLGQGVCDKVFKGKRSQALLAKFIEFLTTAIEKERKNYVAKYTKKGSKKKGVL